MQETKTRWVNKERKFKGAWEEVKSEIIEELNFFRRTVLQINLDHKTYKVVVDGKERLPLKRGAYKIEMDTLVLRQCDLGE